VALGPAQHGGEALLESAVVDQASKPVGGGLLLQRLHHAAVLQRDDNLVRDHAQHFPPVRRKGAGSVDHAQTEQYPFCCRPILVQGLESREQQASAT